MLSSRKSRGWVSEMNSRLRRGERSGFKALDLFCGAGGLSLGFWACGFDVRGIDYNHDAVKTYAKNLGTAECMDLNEPRNLPSADVVIAGPPCQPWSRAGKRLGEQDGRDGLSVALRAIRQVQPMAFVIENVPDLARTRKREYLDDFKRKLAVCGFKVAEFVLNAADYGVPQNRKRIFITGILGTEALGVPVPWPQTISVGIAIPGTCRRNASGTTLVTESMDAYIKRYEIASGCRVPRDLHLDRPARTLTVRNLSGATGDMIRLRLPDGRRRTLTVGEAARLQSFPDWYRLQGNKRSRLEQIGNAVPPLLAFAVAESVVQGLYSLVNPKNETKTETALQAFTETYN